MPLSRSTPCRPTPIMTMALPFMACLDVEGSRGSCRSPVSSAREDREEAKRSRLLRHLQPCLS